MEDRCIHRVGCVVTVVLVLTVFQADGGPPYTPCRLCGDG